MKTLKELKEGINDRTRKVLAMMYAIQRNDSSFTDGGKTYKELLRVNRAGGLPEEVSMVLPLSKDEVEIVKQIFTMYTLPEFLTLYAEVFISRRE